ncbi:helix-turn-helix domain-containing protein [Collinsella intestinalis]|uniref:helix-turn-helix domain-containing protein n=1 Tax=Collinsella intestinalis TaxID=147207 RepID=UPI00241C54AA|nr:helix-turn-helix transcriptional regulator [Collinsella intestinalis]
MSTIDLSQFVEENETAETRAYKHALDISYQIVEEMERQGLNQKMLAGKMGISPARLSTMLNTQPNMTLKSIAQFELALGICFEFTSCDQSTNNQTVEGVLSHPTAMGNPYHNCLDNESRCHVDCSTPASNKILTLQIAA